MSINHTALKIGLGLLFLLPLACQTGSSDYSPMEGKAAPAIILTTADGHSVNLDNQRGKVVVLDFWATWCPPCRESLPHTQKMSDNAALISKGLVVWGIDSTETADVVQKFQSDNHYTFPAAMDPQQTVAKEYEVQAIPQVMIIGRDGIVKHVYVGYDPNKVPEIEKAVDAALAEAPK